MSLTMDHQAALARIIELEAALQKEREKNTDIIGHAVKLIRSNVQGAGGTDRRRSPNYYSGYDAGVDACLDILGSIQ